MLAVRLAWRGPLVEQLIVRKRHQRYLVISEKTMICTPNKPNNLPGEARFELGDSAFEFGKPLVEVIPGQEASSGLVDLLAKGFSHPAVVTGGF